MDVNDEVLGNLVTLEAANIEENITDDVVEVNIEARADGIKHEAAVTGVLTGLGWAQTWMKLIFVSKPIFRFKNVKKVAYFLKHIKVHYITFSAQTKCLTDFN